MQEVNVYIVHLWTARSPQVFRAAVVRAGSDDSAWFTAAEDLGRYFATQARPSAAAPSPPDIEEPS